MVEFDFKSLDKNRYEVSGELNFVTVPQLLEQAGDLIQSGESVSIDFEKVDSANSAAMALLIEWKSVAAQNDAKVTFTNLPKQIERLAEVCGVNSLLLD